MQLLFKVDIAKHTQYTTSMGGNLHVHTSVAGSGFHPSAPHVVIIVVLGTNRMLHLKDISAPSVVF